MKKIFLNLFVSLIMFFGSQMNVSAQFNVVYNEKSKKLDSLYSEIYKYGEFNGNVLIAERDTIIFQKSFGLAKRENNQTLNENSIFNLASITKQFTATALLLLANDGKLSLNDELEKHIPELGFYQGVTINHLIHHTSGLPDYMQLWSEKGEKGKIATNESVIKLFAVETPKLLFVPNQKWEYSNTGYLFLASIIERVSKKSYRDFLKEKIFYPLKMENTDILFVYKDSLDLADLAIGYLEDATGEYKGYSEYAKSFDGVYGQGRIYSTSADLYKWTEGIKYNKIISDADKLELFSETQLNSGEKFDYGFGWFLE